MILQFGILGSGSGWEIRTKLYCISFTNTNYALVIQGSGGVDANTSNQLLVGYGHAWYGAIDDKTISSFNYSAHDKGSYISIGY